MGHILSGYWVVLIPFSVLSAGEASVEFKAQIEPVLKASCLPCHSGDSAQAKLRLDSRAAMLKGGASGPAIVPGKAAESLLYRRIRGDAGVPRMPPAGAPLDDRTIALIGAWIDQGAAWPAGGVDFARDVEPIFAKSCYGCHAGPQPKAGLHLDAKAQAMQGSVNGPVIRPGDSEHSRLVRRVMGLDQPRMPFGGTPLHPDEIATLRRWIDEGAPWPQSAQAAVRKHWAYVKPERPAKPKVQKRGWVRNPIDAFVLAQLEKEGLHPSPEAPREVLIRRLSLDLTGLPPTLQEVNDFVKDRSRKAYKKVVDRLLASPRFGERWARPWLDLARYADTNGFEADARRSIWKYRDWVIGALNRDMPFDQFTIEQLAGDLLDQPTSDSLIATGFHRNSMFNAEGGVDKDEAHWTVLVDRVNTTAAVWLGSTLACAQCHDHKYDPFSQREYYQLMAFFSHTEAKVTENGDTSLKLVEPQLDLPTPEQEARRKAITGEIAEIERTLKTATPELETAQREWERGVVAAANNWTVLKPRTLTAGGATVLRPLEDGSVLASGENPRESVYTIEAEAPFGGVTGIRLEALPDKSLPRGGPGRDPYGNFVLTRLAVESPQAVSFSKELADDGRVNKGKPPQLWSVDATREDQRLPREMVFLPAGKCEGGLLRLRLEQKSAYGRQSIGRFRLSVTQSDKPAEIVEIKAKLRAVLGIPEGSRTEEQKKDLAEFYRSIAPSLEASRQRLKTLKDEEEKLGIATTLIARERTDRQTPAATIRLRGTFTSLGDTVHPGVPAALPPLPQGAPPSRLTLARWLVSKDNPLTARVVVNRMWEQYFGRGIVQTSEDFGAQGERPTHPELLDWLATEFMARKWSMKAIHRLIVMSAAYRQSSVTTPQLNERDPYNRLLARGPRFRMEAETIRDVALAAGGLLSAKIGGPSVFPFQPEGVWDLPYNDDQWEQSSGEDRYRRGIYTFVRRTAPYPSMLTFDAPSREICTVRRLRTNTPLQALTALNDPVFFEAAHALAGRMLREGGADPESRAAYGFRLCVARQPKPDELHRIVTWFGKEREFFTRHPEDAAKIAGAPGAAEGPDAAAWTMVANVLLNLDETVTKE